MLKVVFSFFLLLTVSSCCKICCNNKNKTDRKVFIFDFDNTIIKGITISHVINFATDGDSEKITKISKIIAEKRKEFPSGPITHRVFNDIRAVIGHKISRFDFNQSKNIIFDDITDGVVKSISMIKNAGHRILIIGGGYGTCSVLSDIGVLLGFDKDDVYSGIDSFDSAGDFVIDDKNVGFVKCSTGEKIELAWKKSDVIEKLKKDGNIDGYVVHIGDGKNDLEVKKSNKCDFFIGFGLNKKDGFVKAGADVFVETPEELKREIEKLL